MGKFIWGLRRVFGIKNNSVQIRLLSKRSRQPSPMGNNADLKNLENSNSFIAIVFLSINRTVIFAFILNAST